MVHMPSLEIWEWGLKIFDGAPTLTTHVDHLHTFYIRQTNTEHKPYISRSSSKVKPAAVTHSIRSTCT